MKWHRVGAQDDTFLALLQYNHIDIILRGVRFSKKRFLDAQTPLYVSSANEDPFLKQAKNFFHLFPD